MNKDECISKIAFELMKHYSKIAKDFIPDDIADNDTASINFVLNFVLKFNVLMLESLINCYDISSNLLEIIDRMRDGLKEEFKLNDPT